MNPVWALLESPVERRLSYVIDKLREVINATPFRDEPALEIDLEAVGSKLPALIAPRARRWGRITLRLIRQALGVQFLPPRE